VKNRWGAKRALRDSTLPAPPERYSALRMGFLAFMVPFFSMHEQLRVMIGSFVAVVKVSRHKNSQKMSSRVEIGSSS